MEQAFLKLLIMNKYFIILILVFYTTIAKAQKPEDFAIIDTTVYRCVYLYQFQTDSTNVNSQKSELVALEVGNRVSIYTAKSKFIIDSLLYAYSNEPEEVVFQKIYSQVYSMMPHPYNVHRIYKNYPEPGEIFTDGAKSIQVREKLDFGWNIISDSDSTIQGYNCIKATTKFAGRNYIAWFSPDIPINDGPYKFHGLPGLILDICDTKNEHHFTIQSFSKLQGIKPIMTIAPSKTPQLVCAEEYVKALEVSLAAAAQRIADPAITQTNDDVRANAIRKTKRVNNYIERYK